MVLGNREQGTGNREQGTGKSETAADYISRVGWAKCTFGNESKPPNCFCPPDKLPIPDSLLPTPYSLLPTPYSLSPNSGMTIKIGQYLINRSPPKRLRSQNNRAILRCYPPKGFDNHFFFLGRLRLSHSSRSVAFGQW